MLRRVRAGLGAALALAVATTAASAQGRVPSPKEFFGHDIGADYVLPNYTRLHQYFEQVARASARVDLDTLGRTEEGRPQIMAIVSSPENLRNLERYRTIARRLALAEGVDEAEARRLAREGKAIVWIDGGLHATEVLGAQQLIETLWQLASFDDEETRRFLDDCIILLAHANPDGMELVSDWYMREPDPLKRTVSTIPRLYQKYAGHDNNRDSYMNALKETENMSRALFIDWHPVIMYNHHQTGPAGAVMFAPPFRDPANYNFHPGILTGLELVGAAMHHRFVQEGKGGTVSRTAANYSTWWNGGLRTTVYFHNMIGLLTETIGSPTPIRVPVVPARQLRATNQPLPVEPGEWKFRQSVEYSITANRAVLDVASRYRETFLFNRWKMGRDQIEAGSRDSWTIWPRRIAALEAAMQAARPASGANDQLSRAGAGYFQPGGGAELMRHLRKPEDRDPRAYVLSAAQPDVATATKLVRALQKSGIVVHRATAPFSANGRSYPAGSFVIQTAQAFRPHILDLFEPQDHPNDFRYPGGPPIPPYDNAGWTLAMQMGVQYDRHLEAVTGPFERIDGLATPPAVTVAKGRAGYLIRPEVNDAVTIAQRLAKRNVAVFRAGTAFTDGGATYPAGTWFIPAGGAADEIVPASARALGVPVAGADVRPASAQRVRPLRVALYDRYGGMMPAGWTRLIMEQFEIPFTDVYPADLDAGNLRAKYDVIVFVDGAVAAPGGPGGGGGGFGGSPDTTLIPAEFRRMLGRVTAERTVPQLQAFVEAGGRLVTIGSSTGLGRLLGLPIENHLVEDGRPLPPEKYYIPGSLLEVTLDTTATVTTGMQRTATVMFDASPVFRLGPGAAAQGVRPLAWFDSAEPLKSGWAWGQQYLKGGVAMAEARVGKGTVWLFGPEILFRAQPHGTFKLFLNGLFEGYERQGGAIQ